MAKYLLPVYMTKIETLVPISIYKSLDRDMCLCFPSPWPHKTGSVGRNLKKKKSVY